MTSPWRQNAMYGGHRGGVMKNPKLTPAQRSDIIRRLGEGESPQELALEYGVTASAIRHYR